MAEPETIINWVVDFFQHANQLSGKKVLITAGPTYEAIDPVRFIGNHSSGKMGIALAIEFLKRGAHVTLVCGPVSIPVPFGIKHLPVVSAAEMYDACVKEFENTDIAVMSAAVADYTIKSPAENASPILPHGAHRPARQCIASRHQGGADRGRHQHRRHRAQQAPGQVQAHGPMEGLRVDDEHQDQADHQAQHETAGHAQRGE